MTYFYPCPRCRRGPAVSARATPSGTFWTASCSCIDIHAYNEFGRLAYAWATYCVEMEGRPPMMLNVRGVPREVPPEVYQSVQRASWALAKAVDHLAAAPDSRPVVDEWIVGRMNALRNILRELDEARRGSA